MKIPRVDPFRVINYPCVQNESSSWPPMGQRNKGAKDIEKVFQQEGSQAKKTRLAIIQALWDTDSWGSGANILGFKDFRNRRCSYVSLVDCLATYLDVNLLEWRTNLTRERFTKLPSSESSTLSAFCARASSAYPVQHSDPYRKTENTKLLNILLIT
ncbi:hypothetical protein HUJ04_013139 [Dendroctonus ponderosae]|nr:hypothetical protein HUJ04_013139 [Dendroctonus ponderosae]